MREKIKQVSEKNKEKAPRSPVYVTFLQAIMAFVNAVGAVWNFLFVKRSDKSSEESEKTDTKSFGS